MIKQLLAESGVALNALDAIAFGRGPGAFTGVRIAIGVVQGLAFALERPVLPVSNLAALAQGALREHGVQQVAAAIDARMDEVYWGCYQAAEGEMRLACGIALQRRARQKPRGCSLEAVGRHVEGQMHAPNRVITCGAKFQRGPADLHGIALNGQLHDIGKPRGDGDDIRNG